MLITFVTKSNLIHGVEKIKDFSTERCFNYKPYSQI
jgi:hypothetical protein